MLWLSRCFYKFKGITFCDFTDVLISLKTLPFVTLRLNKWSYKFKDITCCDLTDVLIRLKSFRQIPTEYGKS
jgi:hypothetical protein